MTGDEPLSNTSLEKATVTLDVIGHIESPFDEKFLIPRQPGLVNVRSKLVLHEPYNQEVAVEGLSGISHIWLQFIFDGHKQRKTRNDLRVRPPRLGGNKKMGVFATRSSFRPNPLGLSLVKLSSVDNINGCVSLWLEGGDCLNGTKIVDIKPYLPYADIAPYAENALAAEAPMSNALNVSWSKLALENVQYLSQSGYFQENVFWLSAQDFQQSLSDLLALDPRPPYQKAKNSKQEVGEPREYGASFSGLNIRFQCVGDKLNVLSCVVSSKPQSNEALMV